jgi:Putative DNA-binding domain
VSSAAEAHRQQALLAALWSHSDAPAAPMLQQTGQRAAQGLSAYRANAGALADRALGAVFATVRAMLGEDDFKHLAREFWRAHPPQRGDMGEWGSDFPGWLQAHTAFAEWPYLGDCARLDLAIHQCERAADGELNVESLSLMETVDPAQLCIVLMPGTAVLSSAWPVVTIHRAHAPLEAQQNAQQDGQQEAQREGAQAGPAFSAVRAALAAQQREQLVVATRLLLDATPLSAALERCEGFDFGAWLALALRERWVKEVQRLGD